VFAAIPEAIEAIRRGEMVVLVDDEDRENEGDLVIAAEFADEKAIAFMATKACGLICLSMDGEMLERIGLPMMTTSNKSRMGTAFTVSIEAAEGVTTGISAGDRARTIQAAIADDATPASVVTPGHVFPLRAQEGGVLVRAGQTEGSVDLARLAGCKSAGVICEIMLPDGSMARRDDLIPYCQEHGLLMITVADLIAYRERRERLIEVAAEGALTTSHGPCRAFTFRSSVADEHHLALVFGDALGPGRSVDEPVLVRVQKERALIDACGAEPDTKTLSLSTAMDLIAAEGSGLVLYIRDRDPRHFTAELMAEPEVRAVTPRQPFPVMDPRDYGIGAQILHHLGVRRMRLITSSDRHITALSGFGLEVVERVRP
jgi:3,4-dihydroxy 2-butanone 4-phosphate synthase/GTP cyclohydrolase II